MTHSPTPTNADDVTVRILPCPLCGEKPVRNGRGGTGGVRCVGNMHEHLFQTYGATQAEADAAWNTRIAHQSTGEVERLREAAQALLDAVTRRALRGRDHTPSMRDEQTAAGALRAALAIKGGGEQ